MKRPSLLRRNLWLLLGLIIAGQFTTAVIMVIFVQKPRFDNLSETVLQQLSWLEYSLGQDSPDQRTQLVEQVNASEHFRLQVQTPASLAVRHPRPVFNWVFGPLLKSWKEQARNAGWQLQPQPGIWLELSPGTGGYWLFLNLRGLDWKPSFAWLIVSLLSGVLSLVAAVLIQRRINHPLRILVDAAGQVGQKQSASKIVDHHLPDEIATLADSFNRMLDRLEQADRERAILLAGVSHDLRTPLTKMRLGLELLEGEGVDHDLRCQMIRDIERINSQLGQFMDFARTDLPEEAVYADLNELVMHVVAQFREQGASIDASLGEVPLFRFPPQSVSRVLQNLLDNALKYAGNACEVRTHASDAYIHIVILDRGPGLPMDKIERLSQPFVRGETAAEQPGSGLGLAIVQRIMQRCGGKLTLQQRTGGGLQAEIALPEMN